MNNIVNYYCCFVTILLYMIILKNAHANEPIPIHLNYKGKYTSDIKNYEIVVPQRVNKDGDFISHLVSHHHSKRSTEEMDFIFYKIPIAGKEYLIELTPNRKLISPGAVVETHRESRRKLNKRNSISNDTSNENHGQMFENLNIRRLKDTECHFSGHVKGENISKAALSTCYGLAGFIQIPKGFYTIEPVAGHNPLVEDAYPHILYTADGLENSSVCHTVGELTNSLPDQVIRKRRESSNGQSSPMSIEILVVMDKTLINHHRDSDCENYVLTVFNMAFNLFHDASLGLLMTLSIVRIIRLEVEDDEMNLRVNADAEKTLRYFQTWQYEINPGDDTHPNHHDIAVLITRVDVCFSPSSCGLLGLTTIGKACDPRLSAAVCEDNGLRLGFVIAHEIGHLLGAEHDSTNTTSCNGTDACGLRTVMHPQVSLTAQTWSKCSQAYFKTFFENGMGQCLVDEPEEHHFNVQDLLPGVMYNADFQCKHIITMNSRECDMGSTCESLNCHVPGYACILTHTPPADGTRCGENMWCHNSKCLVVGERPGAIDGNWGEWSSWSDCSRTCGSGVASSFRHCDKPLPSHGGKNCIGEWKRYKICAATMFFKEWRRKYIKKITTVPQNISDLIRFISEEVNVSFVGKPCETGRPSFRDIQCGEFDDWIYPEDGKKHTWKAHYFHEDNPCTLYCISEEKQITALKSRVVDGTMCYRGIRDVCVGGICRNLPCDLHFESNAVEDACGVCHGDGTGCEFTEGREFFSRLPKGLTKLIVVPSGTRNIKVEETEPTLSRIVVRDKETKDFYVRGKTLGMFSVPGSQAWLGMIRKNQEALSIPGPVTKPISIWIQRLANVTVKWSMALPAEQQRKPEFTWDYLKWGPCSARCGPGTQKSEPSCMEEKAGLVEDTFCADLEMPPVRIRPCEIMKCVPRWMVGDWKGCDIPGSSKKERKRVVYCIKPIGENEGESQIVADSECKPPKPHDREPCENRQKREDTEYGENDYNFSKEGSMYRSDTVEFGYHKKYDDYLKNFAALSTPQRKSETIPLHLVSSPHFKDYFRVLQTQDNQAEQSSDAGSDIWLNGTTTDEQTQSKVSPEFYKNTFSGNEIDFSRIKSKISTKQRKSLSPEAINAMRKHSDGTSSNEKSRLRGRNSLARLRALHSGSINSGYGPKSLFLKNSHRRQVDLGKALNRMRKRRFLTAIKNAHRDKSTWRKRRAPKLTFFSVKKSRMNFNYSSPNLTNIIDNISSGNEPLKRKYLNLLENGKPRAVSPFAKWKWKNFQLNPYNPKSLSHKLSDLLNPFCHFTKPMEKNNEKLTSDSEKSEEIEEQMTRLRKLKEDKFDGSGIRKQSLKSNFEFEEGEKGAAREKLKEEDLDRSLFHKGRNFFSNPFDPMHSGKVSLSFKKADFKEGHVFSKDLLVNERTNPSSLRAFTNRDALLMSKRSVKQPFQNKKLKTKVRNYQNLNGKMGIDTLMEKRSSHKRKKVKSKDSGSKSKETSGSGCGVDTKNYLNNLFRDSHSKAPTKPEVKLLSEKPVINAGQLVIDKDSVDDKEIEVVFEDDDGDENVAAFLQLPRPPRNDNRISYKGQQVFDVLQKLQQYGFEPVTECGTLTEAPTTCENVTQAKVTLPYYSSPVNKADETTISSQRPHPSTTPVKSAKETCATPQKSTCASSTSTTTCASTSTTTCASSTSTTTRQPNSMDYEDSDIDGKAIYEETKKKPSTEPVKKKSKKRKHTTKKPTTNENEDDYLEEIDSKEKESNKEKTDSHEEVLIGPRPYQRLNWGARKLMRRWDQRYRQL